MLWFNHLAFCSSGLSTRKFLDIDLAADQLEHLLLHAGPVGHHTLLVCCRRLLCRVFDLVAPASFWVFDLLDPSSIWVFCLLAPESIWVFDLKIFKYLICLTLQVFEYFVCFPLQVVRQTLCHWELLPLLRFQFLNSIFPSHWYWELAESYLQSRRPPPVAARREWGAQVSHWKVEGPVFTYTSARPRLTWEWWWWESFPYFKPIVKIIFPWTCMIYMNLNVFPARRAVHGLGVLLAIKISKRSFGAVRP